VIPAAVLAAPVVVADAAERLPVAPFRLVRPDGVTAFELRADGVLVGEHGTAVGHIADGKVTLDELSQTLWTVDADGKAHCTLLPHAGRFDEDDALVLDWDGEHRRLAVRDDGTVVLEDPGGARRPAPLRVEGVTARSRRAAVLLALSALLLERREREARRRPMPRVTLTVGAIEAAAGYLDLVSELRLERRWSLAVRAGGGSRPLSNGSSGSTVAWELGLEPRWYFVGNFGTGFFLAWTTRFAHARVGPVGFESGDTPAGLSSGGLVGFKSVDVPIITPEASVGLVVPLVVPGTEVSHPAVALVWRIGIGFSF
jgi:hypothetical protein